MNHLTYEEYLEKNGSLTYRNVGTSMLPLLKQGRDLFIVERKTQVRCKKYDVILYRRPPGQYVLHRIVQVRDADYVLLGDNCINKEYGIKDEDVLGVMTGYVRKGKQRSCKSLPYLVYSRVWTWVSPLRILGAIILLKSPWRRAKAK